MVIFKYISAFCFIVDRSVFRPTLCKPSRQNNGHINWIWIYYLLLAVPRQVWVIFFLLVCWFVLCNFYFIVVVVYLSCLVLFRFVSSSFLFVVFVYQPWLCLGNRRWKTWLWPKGQCQCCNTKELTARPYTHICLSNMSVTVHACIEINLYHELIEFCSVNKRLLQIWRGEPSQKAIAVVYVKMNEPAS